VVDFSPGSGALARACLELGIKYVGICRTAEHCSWLINVTNRAAVEIATREGTTLYDQDLAKMLSTHFQELLDELHAQDAAKSDDEEEK